MTHMTIARSYLGTRELKGSPDNIVILYAVITRMARVEDFQSGKTP